MTAKWLNEMGFPTLSRWFDYLGYEGLFAVFLLVYFIAFQLPKLILLFVRTNKYSDHEIGGNSNVKPRGPEDYR